MATEHSRESAVGTLHGKPLAAHDHVCLAYDSDEQRDETMTGFLAEGVLFGQRCLCLIGAEQHDRLAADVDDRCEPDDSDDRGRLDLVAPEDSYLRGGRFSSERMRGFWDDRMPVSRGTFARVVADMSWAAAQLDPPIRADLIRYEADFTTRRHAWQHLTLCLYDTRLFARDLLIRLSSVHTHLWAGGHLLANGFHDELAVRFRDRPGEN